MPHSPDIPELIEQYMESSGTAERWVTVRELRNKFHLNESAGPAFAGFLQKIHHGTFFACRYKVARIEKFRDTAPPYRIIRKYLIQKRPAQRRNLTPVDPSRPENIR